MQVTFLLLLPIALLSGMACGLAVRDPIKRPAFLTPVAEATKAGLEPYWLGAEFRAGGEVFRIDGEASFGLIPGGGSALGFGYGARRGAGGTLGVSTYSSNAQEDETLREQAASNSRGEYERVSVGRWRGELYTIASATKPVGALLLFLDVDGKTIIVDADAGSTGILGQDVNVLLDKDALVSTLAALRPYPQ